MLYPGRVMSDDRLQTDGMPDDGAPRRTPGRSGGTAPRPPAAPDVARASAPVVPGAAGVPAESAEDPDARGTLLALFGGAKRAGAWEPPARLVAISIFGGIQLDFCEADLLEGESVVEAYALFGGVEIRVPPDIDVITEGIGVFGHFGQKDQRGDDPRPPLLRVKGFALFGGVDVKGPRKRDRWRRRDR